MCSDMPMEDMASDEDFGKKWMFAIALCLNLIKLLRIFLFLFWKINMLFYLKVIILLLSLLLDILN